MFRIQLEDATMEDARALGKMVVEQVRARFRTQGKSGGVYWPPSRPFGSKRSTRALAGLEKTWKYEISKRRGGVIEVEVFTDSIEAATNHFGTVGKGGELPTIRPVKAKALFIPISDRAKNSMKLSGKDAVFFRRQFGLPETRRGIRVGTAKSGVFNLIQGRIKDGELMIQNEDGEWVPGQADFIFLKKVDLPPRPQIPDSEREMEKQDEFVERLMS